MVEMEIVSSSLLLLATILFLYNFITTTLSKPNKYHPPTPPSLPIFGHLHLLKPPFHRTLQTLSQRYGPVFALRLGHHPVLVVSSPEAAEECFTKNDIVLANRPNLLLGKLLGYNNSILIWASYGPHWRNLRRVATLTTLSQKQILLAGPACRAEVRAMIKVLRAEGGAREVNLSEVFGNMTYSLLLRVMAGKGWELGEDKIVSPSGMFINVCDFLPFLRWVGYKGIEKEMIEFNKKRDEMLQKLVDEGRNKRGNDVKVKNSVIDELLELQDGQPDYYTDEVLKGIILVLIIAGSDTTAKTLEWAMTNLLNNPITFEKARNEIETNINEGCLVRDSDIPKLNYIRCIINETLRLFPPAPLLLPHFSSQDCTLRGYHVPKGTMLFVNAWALHRDPNIWDDATKFKPERFENEKEGFMYMPFGLGRRACPGSNFALRIVTLVLATLIQCFDWEKAEHGNVDLNERTRHAIIMPKEKPLKAMCSPRSSMEFVISKT